MRTIASRMSVMSGEGALSVFARAVERLRVATGLTCSFASGDSDVLFIKKTPFYQMICHFSGLVRLNRPLDAESDGNLSSQPHKKDCPLLNVNRKETDPRWCSARHKFVCALRRRGYGY